MSTFWSLRMAVVLAALLAAFVVSPIGAAADDVPVEDTPPVVSNGLLSPGILTYLGGSVTISADVVDDVGVASVSADVQGSDGTTQTVELLQTSGPTYSGNVDVPPNFTDSMVTYSVTVNATDTNDAIGTLVLGEIQVDPQPQFDEPPIVANPSVDPRDLPAAGGTVTIEADASDLRGITEAFATIVQPDGTSVVVPMDPISSSRFAGTFTAPANSGTAAQQYAITVTAYDDIGQPGYADAGVLTVAGRPAQRAGRLTVSPGTRSFGRVRVGTGAWRWVVVHNAGPRSTAPVEGVIRASGAPFSVAGAGADGSIHFRLRPGQSRAVLVAFRPYAAGWQTGSLLVQRSDGAQAGLAARLWGQGTHRRWRGDRSRPES
jgi:hypothetical protein